MFSHFLIQSRLVFAVALLAAAPFTRAQSLDLNGNGASDVWEHIFNAENIDPDLDSDGDGVPNRLEAIAGTDPFDSRSLPRISAFTAKANGISLSSPGVPGKRYELQAIESLCGSSAGNWFTETSTVCRKESRV